VITSTVHVHLVAISNHMSAREARVDQTANALTSKSSTGAQKLEYLYFPLQASKRILTCIPGSDQPTLHSQMMNMGGKSSRKYEHQDPFLTRVHLIVAGAIMDPVRV
jgi:hypothetical protein